MRIPIQTFHLFSEAYKGRYGSESLHDPFWFYRYGCRYRCGCARCPFKREKSEQFHTDVDADTKALSLDLPLNGFYCAVFSCINFVAIKQSLERQLPTWTRIYSGQYTLYWSICLVRTKQHSSFCLSDSWMTIYTHCQSKNRHCWIETSICNFMADPYVWSAMDYAFAPCYPAEWPFEARMEIKSHKRYDWWFARHLVTMATPFDVPLSVMCLSDIAWSQSPSGELSLSTRFTTPYHTQVPIKQPASSN